MRGNVKVYQKKIVDRRRKKMVVVSVISTLSFLLVIGGLVWLSQIKTFHITEIQVEGNKRLAESTIISLVEEKLVGNYLGLFSRKNIFLYPEDAVIAALEVFPVIQEVDVEGKGLHTVIVKIKERSEVARLCEGQLGEIVACFSIDEEGFMFDAAPLDDTGVVILYRDAELVEPLGKHILISEDFKTLQFFMRELEGLGIKPFEVLLVEANYMKVILEGGGQLIINRADDLSEVLSNLASLLSDKKNIPSLTDFVAHLDYMRLDSGNKIFYKLK